MTHFVWVFFLNTKDQVVFVFLIFEAIFKLMYGFKTIKSEFKPFSVALKKECLVYQRMCPHISKHSGIVES